MSGVKGFQPPILATNLPADFRDLSVAETTFFFFFFGLSVFYQKSTFTILYTHGFDTCNKSVTKETNGKTQNE